MKTIRLVFLTSAFPVLFASAELVPNGEFQFYKPGEPDVTAEITGGWVPWNGVISPTNLTILGGGSANYSDSTTGSTVDLPGWKKIRGNADVFGNGPAGSNAFNAFGSWGGQTRIESAEPLGTVQAGGVYTISVMVGGPDTGPIEGPLAFHLLADGVQLTPTSSVEPTLPNGGAFQLISRTYEGAALADHVGASLTIVLGVEDDNAIGNRVIFDDVSIEGIGSGTASFQLVITPTAGSPGNYDFEWESQSGRLYDLVSATDLASAPSSWPVWNGQENLPATPPSNTLSVIPGGGEPRRFFAMIEKVAPPPPPLLAEDFESGTPAGWGFSDNRAGTIWTVGSPNGTPPGEPSAAANGTLCAGTNINSNYTASAIASLVTPAFTVPAGGAVLTFNQYIDSGAASGGGDFGSVRLLNAADDTPLAGGVVIADIQGISMQWSSESQVLPAAANGLAVKLEFRFESNADSDVFAGFYIDDVSVEAVVP
jgi:hypothetical protein